MTKEDFKKTITDFIENTGMSATAFGLAAANNPNFVFDINKGRECREETQARILNFINNYKENSDEETSC